MASYYCVCRTNYFNVKDSVAFKEWASRYDVRVIENDGMVGLVGENADGGAWPSYDGEDDKEIDFAKEISEHLCEGEVAVLMEAGHEKERYVVGHAIAVRAGGDFITVNLQDIYKLAEKKWGKKPSLAEY